MNAPKSIRLVSGGAELICQFADNDSRQPLDCSFSAEYLRVFSPSAELRGHATSQQHFDFPEGKRMVTINDIERAGHYAIKIGFSDGHDSGIYTWALLRELHQNWDSNWQHYKSQLDQRGLSRDPNEQVIKIM